MGTIQITIVTNVRKYFAYGVFVCATESACVLNVCLYMKYIFNVYLNLYEITHSMDKETRA